MKTMGFVGGVSVIACPSSSATSGDGGCHEFGTSRALKGEERKQELLDVQLGPDGKPQKTNSDPNMSDDERHRRGLQARIRERKIEEYKEYAEQMKSLMQQYVPAEKALLDQAYQQGNVMFGPAGIPN